MEAPNDVHRQEAPQRLEEHPAVPDGQVGSLNQRVAHISCKQCLFEVGFGVGTRRQQHDAGVVMIPGRRTGQCFPVRPKVSRKAPDIRCLKRFRQSPIGHEPIFQGKSRARGSIGPIPDDPPIPVLGTCKIDCVHGQPHAITRL